MLMLMYYLSFFKIPFDVARKLKKFTRGWERIRTIWWLGVWFVSLSKKAAWFGTLVSKNIFLVVWLRFPLTPESLWHKLIKRTFVSCLLSWPFEVYFILFFK